MLLCDIRGKEYDLFNQGGYWDVVLSALVQLSPVCLQSPRFENDPFTSEL